jgi:outer membrane lipoprotein carrier protein
MNFVLTTVLFLSVSAGPKTAKDVARAFDAHYRSVQTMAAYFLDKYTSGGAGLVAESGTVYFEKPGRMRWDYDSPQKKMFLVDGKNVWFYVPADHTASRSSIKESADWRTPLALLAGRVNLERLCGSLTLAGSTAELGVDKTASQAGDSVLVCGPRKQDENVFREVLLEVNSQNQLVWLDIKEPGDIENEFRFGDWHENVPIEASKFHFEPPAGVAIVNDESLAIKVR